MAVLSNKTNAHIYGIYRLSNKNAHSHNVMANRWPCIWFLGAVAAVEHISVYTPLWTRPRPRPGLILSGESNKNRHTDSVVWVNGSGQASNSTIAAEREWQHQYEIIHCMSSPYRKIRVSAHSAHYRQLILCATTHTNARLIHAPHIHECILFIKHANMIMWAYFLYSYILCYIFTYVCYIMIPNMPICMYIQ